MTKEEKAQAAAAAAAAKAAEEEAAAAAAKAAGRVEAFVLRDCSFGRVGDVVELPLTDAETGAAHGMLDLHPAAVAAAKKAE